MKNYNPFWRNTRLEKHFPDPLDTPPAPPANEKLTCEFCGCELSKRGEVLRRGENARQFLKHDQTLEEKDREIARLNAELSAVKAERDSLKASSSSGPAPHAEHRPGDRITR